MASVPETEIRELREVADIDLAAEAKLIRLRASGLIYLGRVVIIATLLLAWQFGSGVVVPTYLISKPSEVGTRLYELFVTGAVWPDLAVTSEALFLGFSAGVAGGVIVGVVLGTWKLSAQLFEPIISAVNGIPKIALAPLFLIWFGIGITSKVAIAAMTVFFVMFYNVYMGMSTIPVGLLVALQIMGAGRPTIIRYLILPQLSVPILAGLRAGVSFAMIGVVVGEFVAASQGVGYYVRSSSNLFDAAGVYAGIILLMCMVLIGIACVSALEHRLLRWRQP